MPLLLLLRLWRWRNRHLLLEPVALLLTRLPARVRLLGHRQEKLLQGLAANIDGWGRCIGCLNRLLLRWRRQHIRQWLGLLLELWRCQHRLRLQSGRLVPEHPPGKLPRQRALLGTGQLLRAWRGSSPF